MSENISRFRIIELGILGLTFILALISFIYNSIQFVKENAEIYKFAVVSNSTASSTETGGMESLFSLTNIGNRAIYIHDSWVTLEIDNEEYPRIKSDKVNKELVKLYFKDVNYSHFHFNRELDVELASIRPGETVDIKAQGAKKFEIGQYYNILPRAPSEVIDQLGVVVEILQNTNVETSFQFRNEIAALHKRSSRYMVLYLNIKLQLEDSSVRFVKVPYDYIVMYKNGNERDAPLLSLQLNSYFPRISDISLVDVSEMGLTNLKVLAIRD